MDGTVYFGPNGEIRTVGNSSMEWSLTVLDVTVAADADLAAVQAGIAEEARQLAGDPAFAPLILEAPQVWGVQTMTADGVTVRVTVKTAPRQQWVLARELRNRLAARLRRDGVVGAGGPGKSPAITAGPLDQGPPVPP